MKLYVLRHGEALDDIEDCYGGVADFPLTDKGREQARALAQQLHNAHLQTILSSPLARALETAQIIAAELDRGIDVTVIEDLKERNSYGVLSGVNKTRAAQIFKHVLKDLKEKPGYSREPLLGAEDFDEFVQRVHHAFHEALAFARQQQLDHLAIVTHGTFTRALFEHVFGFGTEVVPRLGAINIIDYQPAIATLETGLLVNR